METTRVFTRGDGIRWQVVLGLAALDVSWLALTGRTVTRASLHATVIAILMLLAIAWLLAAIAGLRRVTSTSRGLHYRRLALAAHGGAWLVAFTGTLSVLSYLLATLAFPLVDGRLARIDVLMGFDWPSVYAWVRARPVVNGVFELAYASGLLQLVLVPMLAALLGRASYVREFFSNLLVSILLLLLVATLWPAAGAFFSYGVASPAEVASVSDFAALRNGTLQVFDLTRMQGLVSLPSYHAALALFFVQAMRWSRIGLWGGGLLNGLMLLSTPTEGGHYLVDVVAGVALWGVTVLVMRRIANRQVPQTARATATVHPRPASMGGPLP